MGELLWSEGEGESKLAEAEKIEVWKKLHSMLVLTMNSYSEQDDMTVQVVDLDTESQVRADMTTRVGQLRRLQPTIGSGQFAYLPSMRELSCCRSWSDLSTEPPVSR
jgi:hypothetical protein